jgi:hypothetical protein
VLYSRDTWAIATCYFVFVLAGATLLSECDADVSVFTAAVCQHLGLGTSIVTAQRQAAVADAPYEQQQLHNLHKAGFR